jgi:hypothetical protein
MYTIYFRCHNIVRRLSRYRKRAPNERRGVQVAGGYQAGGVADRWVSDGRKWVLGSSKATNVACLAVFAAAYLTPALTALHLGNQNASKKAIGT